ncbi:MAG: hypothetical protein KDC07_02705 [Chitinophagaceae bacterium]|nr:hypothetical protein [Chitinophagaceae bacterium]
MTFAILVGLLKPGRYSTLYRLLLLQVVLALMAEVGGYIVALVFHNSNWFHNVYIIADFATMLAIWYTLSNKRRSEQLVVLTLVVSYLSLWLHQVINSGTQIFAHRSYLFGCAVIVLLFLNVIFDTIRSRGDKDARLVNYVISISVIVFYCGQIPLFGFLNMLNANFPKLSKQLFNINFALEITRYLFVAYVFYISTPVKTDKRTIHE